MKIDFDKTSIGLWIMIAFLLFVIIFMWCSYVQINREPELIQEIGICVSTNEKILAEIRKTNISLSEQLRERFEWLR